MPETRAEVARASSPCFLGRIRDPRHGLEARATSEPPPRQYRVTFIPVPGTAGPSGRFPFSFL